jgi:hypothetical protein
VVILFLYNLCLAYSRHWGLPRLCILIDERGSPASAVAEPCRCQNDGRKLYSRKHVRVRMTVGDEEFEGEGGAGVVREKLELEW